MEPQQDILANIEGEIVMEDASKGQRFVNLLIDGIIVSIVQGIIKGVMSFNVFSPAYLISSSLISLAIYFAYYTLLESTKGQTVGKMITNTKVVRSEDYGQITAGEAALRTLVRMLSLLDAISFLFDYPWHDRWTKTRVVKSK